MPLRFKIIRKCSIIAFCASLNLISCVPVQQATTTNKLDKVRNEDFFVLVENAERFKEVLNPISTEECRKLKITEENLPDINIQSTLQIDGYGEVFAGKISRYTDRRNSIEIIEDYLIVPVTHGGGYPMEGLILFDLIWDGKYYTNVNGNQEVKVVISYKNIDIRRALFYRKIGFDLSPLKTDATSAITVKLLGYNKTLVYTY